MRTIGDSGDCKHRSSTSSGSRPRRTSIRHRDVPLCVGTFAILLVGLVSAAAAFSPQQPPLLRHWLTPSSLTLPQTQPSSSVLASSSSGASNANELVPLRRGSSVALVTPFDPQTGQIDFASLKRLLQYHLDAGTTNLCILGTTGEASLLDTDERRQVLQTAVKMVKGRMCILVGTGTINPRSVREMTLQALDLGCDASLVVTPYYVKPPQRGLIRHMVDAADLGLPVVVYNVPGRTGVNMLDESLAVVAQHPNVAGVKDATGDLTRLRRLKELVREKGDGGTGFLFFSGDDATSIDYVLEGGDGCISVTANVAASDMANMMKLALQGQADEAKAVNDRLAALHQKLFLESNPIPAKWAVQRLGLIESAVCRPPLDQFDEATFGSQLLEALRQANLLS